MRRAFATGELSVPVEPVADGTNRWRQDVTLALRSMDWRRLTKA